MRRLILFALWVPLSHIDTIIYAAAIGTADGTIYRSDGVWMAILVGLLGFAISLTILELFGAVRQ